jgi:hypothetical protein
MITPVASHEAVTYDSQISDLRHEFDQIKDPRASNCSYALTDLLMSVFAMFSLKYESLLDFEKQTQATTANLKNIFGIKKFSSDSCLRKILDKVDWKELRSLYKKQFEKSKTLGVIDDYRYLTDYLLVSVDGVEHFSSKNIHCPSCLTRQHKNGQTTYTHSMLCAVLVHPQQSEVFVIGTEPIQQQDGREKNDCERNASKRLVDWLSTNYKDEKLILVEDALYSTAPNIEQIRASNWDFILGVKPDSHKHLFRLLDIGRLTGKLVQTSSYKKGKESYNFWFFNEEGINGSNLSVKVNFLYCEQIDAKGKVTVFSWVTSLLVTPATVFSIMKAGRARWKIENETFNTLKNQGYRFAHNYGHGQEHLSCVFAHLMLLAFLSDQVIQRCNHQFQAVRVACATKVKLWFCVRAAFFFKEFETFRAIYLDIGRQFKLQLE